MPFQTSNQRIRAVIILVEDVYSGHILREPWDVWFFLIVKINVGPICGHFFFLLKDLSICMLVWWFLIRFFALYNRYIVGFNDP